MVPRTVKFHVASILSALGLSKRTQVVAAHGKAMSNGRVTGLRSRLESERLVEVYDLMVKGSSQREIAASLGITVRTVKFHSQAILEALGLPNQVRLVAAHWGTDGPVESGGVAGVRRTLSRALAEMKAERARIDEVVEQLELAARVLSR